MPNPDKAIRIGIPLALGAAAFLFFCTAYPAHVHFQEQFQMFLFTWDYFCDVTSAPGGFADWLGRFLNQFSYLTWGGALVNALLVVLVQLPSSKLCGDESCRASWLGCIPALLAWMFLCDENALHGGVVALILILAAISVVNSMGNGKARKAIVLPAIPLLYFLCGPLAVLFPILVKKDGSKALWVASILIAAACPFVAYAAGPMSFGRYFSGMHYFRYDNVFPTLLWISAASCIVPALSALIKAKPAEGADFWIQSALAAASLAVAGVYGVRASSDFSDEKIMAYDSAARTEDWNAIIAMAEKETPMSPMSASYLNMALAEKGILCDRMFDFFQNGVDGLIAPLDKDHFSSLPTGEAFYRLGMASMAERYFFEAQEAIPDKQLSSRCCLRIAQALTVNGQYAAADKYTELLRHTLFYRKAALALREGTPETDRLAAFRSRENFLLVGMSFEDAFRRLYLSNQENSLAYQYMMAGLMLDKYLEGIMAGINIGKLTSLPKHLQEAVLMFTFNSTGSLESLPDCVSRENAKNFVEFYKAYSDNKDATYMNKHFGNTLWYYMVYREL